MTRASNQYSIYEWRHGVSRDEFAFGGAPTTVGFQGGTGKIGETTTHIGDGKNKFDTARDTFAFGGAPTQ